MKTADADPHLTSRGGRLSADIQAVIAADYSRNLREETKKGINYRLQQGLYPFRAPLGYINNGGGKPKTVDPLRAPFIVGGFRLYAQGAVGLQKLSTTMFDQGLRTRYMRKVSINTWSKIFRNPFCTGTMHVTGTSYPGIHEPIVSDELFDSI